jgi:hypothetical protein
MVIFGNSLRNALSPNVPRNFNYILRCKLHVESMTPPAPYEKSKFLGSEGSMVARPSIHNLSVVNIIKIPEFGWLKSHTFG